MFKTSGWLATAMLMAAAAQATATDLRVTGTLKPGACAVAFEGGGQIDHGQLAASSLSQIHWNPMPAQQVGFTIQCSGPTSLGMHWIDNRAGTSALDSPAAHGLGLHKGKKIGGTLIVYVIESLEADGAPASLWRQDVGPWVPTTGMAWLSSTFGFNADPVDGPAAHTAYAGQLALSTIIVPLQELDQSEQVMFDGNTTLWLEYI